MSEESKADLLASLDRRVLDHDNKIIETHRDFTQLSHQIEQLTERINHGLSPSVNAVRQDNADIKLQLADLKHKGEIDLRDMKAMIREATEHTRSMVANFRESEVAPVKSKLSRIEQIFIYGLVGALLVFAGQKAMGNVWDKIFGKRVSVIATE